MKSFRIVILGGGMVAGYAAKEFVAQGGKKGELAIVTAENALPYERPPLSKGFLAGKEKASGIQISDAAFYREHGIAIYRNFPVAKVDFRRRRLKSSSGRVIGFDQLLIATGSTVRRLKVPGADRSQIFYLRRIKDAQAIRAQVKRGRRAVVIGSGFIGRFIDWEVHRRRALRARCYGFGEGMVFRFWSPCPVVWLPSWS